MNWGERKRIDNRRPAVREAFTFGGHNFHLGIGYYRTGRPAEIFITMDKMGTPMENLARDAAIAISLAMQYGCPPQVMRTAFLRDGQGKPETMLARALDMVCKLQEVEA